MKLVDIILEVSIEQLQRDWVDAGKVSQELFDLIKDACKGKSAYITWTLKRHSEGQISISEGSASMLEMMFELFDKYKNKLFSIFSRDINNYKSTRDIQQLYAALVEAKKRVDREKESKDVEKFSVGKVNLRGRSYEVYRLPHGHPENRQAAVILGRHVPGDKGWCTSYDGDTEGNYWNSHISNPRYGDIYVFVNTNDRLRDKFQIQVGYQDNKPFPVKTDQPVEDSKLEDYTLAYDFISNHEGKRVYPAALVEESMFKDAMQNGYSLDKLQVSGKEGIYRIPTGPSEDMCRAYKPLMEEIFKRKPSKDHFRLWYRDYSEVGSNGNEYYLFSVGKGKPVLLTLLGNELITSLNPGPPASRPFVRTFPVLKTSREVQETLEDPEILNFLRKESVRKFIQEEHRCTRELEILLNTVVNDKYLNKENVLRERRIYSKDGIEYYYIPSYRGLTAWESVELIPNTRFFDGAACAVKIPGKNFDKWYVITGISKADSEIKLQTFEYSVDREKRNAGSRDIRDMLLVANLDPKTLFGVLDHCKRKVDRNISIPKDLQIFDQINNGDIPELEDERVGSEGNISDVYEISWEKYVEYFYDLFPVQEQNHRCRVIVGIGDDYQFVSTDTSLDNIAIYSNVSMGSYRRTFAKYPELPKSIYRILVRNNYPVPESVEEYLHER